MTTNTPVAFVIFNRPDLTKKTFEAIAKAKPKKLLVIADGARSEEEAEKCIKAKKIIERIDWDCKLLTNYSEKNLGYDLRSSSGFDWIFSKVDEAIFFEDDTVPHISFFSFCEKMLDRYREDTRVFHINGNNFVTSGLTKHSYYFSKYMHCWGWASWKRAWKYYDYSIKSWPAFKKSGLMECICESKAEIKYWTRIFEIMHENPKNIDTWDYQWLYACWSQGGLSITPDKNLVSNIGFNRKDAVHTTGDSPWSNFPRKNIGKILDPSFVVSHKEGDKRSFRRIFLGKGE